ncbi:hypothetical protein QBC37DRAFT_374972 [Rhypophila decipiens]|uniref:RRM domain-containing protein n=1 Tax=Rhypophila decipiens TaxID=261697 RepID=A0AAN6Y4V1_9PEZI|nr:hypothetical protein QBC37DRAFT_374972 [Rhypophila decipiens]
MSSQRASAVARNPALAGPWRNTLLITNLPPNVNIKNLLDRITIAGPFGKLYSAHISTVNPWDPYAPPFPHAVLAFFRNEDALHLHNFMNKMGICMGRHVLVGQFARYNFLPEVDVAEDGNDQDPSRTVLVTGPKWLMTRDNLVTKIKINHLKPFHRIVQVKETAEERQFAVLFTCYSNAKRAISIFKSRKNAVKAVYGRDPMAVGVKTKVDPADNTSVTIKFSGWNVKRDETNGNAVEDQVHFTQGQDNVAVRFGRVSTANDEAELESDSDSSEEANSTTVCESQEHENDDADSESQENDSDDADSESGSEVSTVKTPNDVGWGWPASPVPADAWPKERITRVILVDPVEEDTASNTSVRPRERVWRRKHRGSTLEDWNRPSTCCVM